MPALFRIVQDDHPPIPPGVSPVCYIYSVRLRSCSIVRGRVGGRVGCGCANAKLVFNNLKSVFSMFFCMCGNFGLKNTTQHSLPFWKLKTGTSSSKTRKNQQFRFSACLFYQNWPIFSVFLPKLVLSQNWPIFCSMSARKCQKVAKKPQKLIPKIKLKKWQKVPKNGQKVSKTQKAF